MAFRFLSKVELLAVLAIVLVGGALPAAAEEAAAEDTEVEVAVDEASTSTIDQADDAPGLLFELPDASVANPLPPLSPEQEQLRDHLRKVLASYYPQHLDTNSKSCWEVMHGIIAYGVDAKLFRGSPGGQKVNAIGWMCYNQPCHGEQLFYLDRGSLVARRGPGLQGHLGQFLAIIAQSHVPSNFPMRVGGKQFTVEDLIEHEKLDCRDGEELTFKLIGLSHYLDSDAEWTTRDGQKWNIQRLIREELKQPILRVAACGGNHRLMGHSYALYKRRKQGKPIDGQFARAEKFIADYHRYTYSLQNPDGSFSTRWFEGREARPDIDRRLKTTGHTFEWMAFSVPEDQLRGPKMTKAANYLVNLLERNPRHTWEVGPLGHALHSLRIYDRRVFKPYDAPSSTPVEEAAPAPMVTETPAEKPPIETAKKPKPATSKETTSESSAKERSTDGPQFPSLMVKESAEKEAPSTDAVSKDFPKR